MRRKLGICESVVSKSSTFCNLHLEGHSKLKSGLPNSPRGKIPVIGIHTGNINKIKMSLTSNARTMVIH
jgi:hypothetical protein